MDLAEDGWEVTRAEWEQFAAEESLLIFETSACVGKNIETMFTEVSSYVLANNRDTLPDTGPSRESVILSETAAPRERKQCPC